jgi:sulfur relay (sulfurtransferase) complex TusBCD TusD component (DsrE family)
LQSKFLLKNPNVCLSVCVLCNKTRGWRKKEK